MCWCECKNPMKNGVCKDIWNPSSCACEINRYLKSIADDFIITCDEVIDVSMSLNDIKAIVIIF